MITTGFAEAVADRMAAEHALLAARWFARLRDLLPVDANEVFPSDSLLDHIPSLIVDISAYLKAPEDEAIAANTLVVEKARELGTLRHQQRASLHQVLREYQLLGGILLRFVEDESIRLMLTPPPAECIAVVSRLHHAVGVLLQETVETFVGLYTETITDQAERLRQFTRMATHEWRQPLAPISTAVSLLRLPGLQEVQRAQTVELIARNVKSLVDMTYKLERLARIDGDVDNASLQEVSLTAVAAEAARQLREMADARGVAINIAEDMPTLVVDVGRLELALVNLLSNAIKYCDSSKPSCAVDVTGRVLEDGRVELCIRDNGIGIPKQKISQIFRRFTRAHTDNPEHDAVTGVGLGLAIVDDCVKAMDGTITVESTEGVGTMFCVTLPAGPKVQNGSPSNEPSAAKAD
ncbi:MAG TPA: HAMP domain-containing sensor histidine kinase [Vicinamibacterales bacterium]|nr:HAMP domain-containing sensor histidine kinase [Vicinamibacterales bacterium]